MLLENTQIWYLIRVEFFSCFVNLCTGTLSSRVAEPKLINSGSNFSLLFWLRFKVVEIMVGSCFSVLLNGNALRRYRYNILTATFTPEVGSGADRKRTGSATLRFRSRPVLRRLQLRESFSWTGLRLLKTFRNFWVFFNCRLIV